MNEPRERIAGCRRWGPTDVRRRQLSLHRQRILVQHIQQARLIVQLRGTRIQDRGARIIEFVF